MVHMRTKPAGPDRFSQLTPFSTYSLRNREPGQAAGGPVQQRSAATRPTSIESRATGVTPSPAQTTFADLAVSEKDVIAALGPGQAQTSSGIGPDTPALYGFKGRAFGAPGAGRARTGIESWRLEVPERNACGSASVTTRASARNGRVLPG